MKIKTQTVTKISLVAFAIIAVSCLISLVFLLVGGIKDTIYANKEQNNRQAATKNVLGSTPDYGETYIDNMIFICDGTLSPIKDFGILKQEWQIFSGERGSLSLDYSIDTATIVYSKTAESLSISEAIEKELPQYVVITLGIDNGVGYCTEEKFTEYYQKLIDTVVEASPNTKIILQSIFPVSSSYQKVSDSIDNSKIDRANAWIQKLADKNSLRYLDTASCLKNDKGLLDSKYDSGDGLHLNSDGYTAVINYIRTHGYK